MFDGKDFGETQSGRNTFIAQGSEFSGKLTFEGTVEIDGKVDGEIFSKGKLIIGSGAEINAKINVESVLISGLIHGDIEATQQIEMKAPGRLYGNIKTPALIIEKGVIFEGKCQMENLEGAASTSKPAPQPSSLPKPDAPKPPAKPLESPAPKPDSAEKS